MRRVIPVPAQPGELPLGQGLRRTALVRISMAGLVALCIACSGGPDGPRNGLGEAPAAIPEASSSTSSTRPVSTASSATATTALQASIAPTSVAEVAPARDGANLEAPSDNSLTITKTVDGSTITVPLNCVTEVSRGSWYLTTQSWPANDACAVPHANGDRPARYFAFEVYGDNADVTIRMGATQSSSPQDTYLELYRAAGITNTGGRDAFTVNLDTASANAPTNDDTEHHYLDGYATDSRLQLVLVAGVYVVAATVPPATIAGTSVAAEGQFTLNIKVVNTQPGG